MTALLLAADIGGTKALLQLSRANGEVLLKQRYQSRDYDSFDAILATFLQQAGQPHIAAACFAVAAPITGRQVKVTNLPWLIDADHLCQHFAIDTVLLCNDFEAVGYGIEMLGPEQLMTVQTGECVNTAPRAVMGVGTGLGQALLIEQRQGWQVYPSEGGHSDFAATDMLQIRLVEYLLQREERVTVERLLSGKGLESIYVYLRDALQIDENPDLRLAMVHGDAAAAISEYAATDALAEKSMALFFSLYGAQAGNFALTTLPRQGLYIAGGIAAKNAAWFERDEFMQAFLHKAPMQHIVECIPVHIILDTDVGLLGAQRLALKAMYN